MKLGRSWGGRGEGQGRSRGTECSCPKNASSCLLFVQRIHLEIRVGQRDLDAGLAQAKDRVNEVSFKLEHLIEQIEQIVKEQNYQRVSLPLQLIFSLPARNAVLETSPKPRKEQTVVPGSFSELAPGGHSAWRERTVFHYLLVICQPVSSARKGDCRSFVFRVWASRKE